MKQIEIDNIYRNIPLEEISWYIETPPKELVDLVEGGSISPCKTIDLGCGAGNYAIYLASRGFDVTGVDLSPTAIQIAKGNARKRGVTCTFLVSDVLGDLHELKETFDFAYDWEVLHHIFPEQRNRYVENVYRILTREQSTSPSASVRKIPNLADRENTERLGWVLSCTFRLKTS
jgi:2-polyprenyl-3-methyl-5-hydroxy-6-metoxy-1,4-benzoquinol methylase